MTTLYYQGKFGLVDKSSGSYLTQVQVNGASVILSNSSSPGSMGTFILYATTLNPGQAFGQAYFINAHAMLQGNLQYLADQGEINGGGNPVAATTTDIGSAISLEWQVPIYPPPVPAPVGYLQVFTPVDGKAFMLGMVHDLGDYFGWEDNTNPSDVGEVIASLITPGLYAIMQSQSWPKLDLSYVDLSGQDFSGSTYQFTNCNFQFAILDQTNFTGTILSSSNFSGASLVATNFSGANLSSAFFQGTSLTSTNFNGANLSSANLSNALLASAIFTGGANLSSANLSGSSLVATDFTGANLSSTNFSAAALLETNFTGATLSATNFTGCDLTNIVCTSPFGAPTQPSETVILINAILDFTLINLSWQYLDLRGATVNGVPNTLSSENSTLQASGAKLSGMNKNDFSGMSLQYAVLNNAVLDDLDLSSANLSNAFLIGASLHNTKLDDANLTGANLSGAQLGTLAQLFTLPLSTESALNEGDLTTISTYFTTQGITLSSTATLKFVVLNRVWVLNDVGNNVIYTIRLEYQATSITVYETAEPASLSNAYLPGAILTGVNLYAGVANNIQFYGSGTLIDGSAILENAEINNSNLSGLDLTNAQLLGTNLSGSYLFNAKFNNANLTPSADDVPVPTNLSDTNLQGADFTDAQLNGANLTNAAVAVATPTNDDPDLGGVYLFSLPYSGDTNTLSDYETELNAAAKVFSLNPDGDSPTLQKYETALNSNDVSTLETAFLQQSPPITLSGNPQIQTITVNTVWQIVAQPASYTLWTDTDQNKNLELYAAPSMTKTQAAFIENDIPLRWQAVASIDTPEQQWVLDNDSENPQNTSLGYMSFVLKLNGSVLDVYGTALRILQLDTNNQEQYAVEPCNITLLSATNMTGETTCPNGATLQTNQAGSGTWETWMRPSALPKPPPCVPTLFHNCKQTTSVATARKDKH